MEHHKIQDEQAPVGGILVDVIIVEGLVVEDEARDAEDDGVADVTDLGPHSVANVVDFTAERVLAFLREEQAEHNHRQHAGHVQRQLGHHEDAEHRSNDASDLDQWVVVCNKSTGGAAHT